LGVDIDHLLVIVGSLRQFQSATLAEWQAHCLKNNLNADGFVTELEDINGATLNIDHFTSMIP